MNDRACYHCHRVGGSGKRELRPYGPGRLDVCAGCVFGEDGKPGDTRKVKEAKKHLGARLLTPGTLILIGEEQVGPRSKSKKV